MKKTLLAVPLALVLSGCSVGVNDSTEGTDPSRSGSSSVTPADAPDGADTVDGNGFELAAEGFTESTRPGPEGVEMVVLSTDSTTPGGVAEVVAFSDPDPNADIEAAMDVLTTSLTELRQEEDVRQETVDWPGTDKAIAVSWIQETQTAEGLARERYQQLTVANGPDSATVLAVVPEDEFEGSGVLDVLRTFRLD